MNRNSQLDETRLIVINFILMKKDHNLPLYIIIKLTYQQIHRTFPKLILLIELIRHNNLVKLLKPKILHLSKGK